MTIEREPFQVFQIGLKAIAPWIEIAELFLSFQLTPPPHHHRPIRIDPTLYGSPSALLENIIKSLGQPPDALVQALF